MAAEPEVGGKKPVSIFIVVDFPAPFGPRKPRTSPLETVKERSSTAVKPPNSLHSCTASIKVDIAVLHVVFCFVTG
jgi:hypothetical protein